MKNASKSPSKAFKYEYLRGGFLDLMAQPIMKLHLIGGFFALWKSHILYHVYPNN